MTMASVIRRSFLCWIMPAGSRAVCVPCMWLDFHSIRACGGGSGGRRHVCRCPDMPLRTNIPKSSPGVMLPPNLPTPPHPSPFSPPLRSRLPQLLRHASRGTRPLVARGRVHTCLPGDHMYFPQRRRGAVTTVHC
ncbi:hypothetical protein M433DRAFT_388050 [Acidomyces richmondensis BFW]|nr:MAG: hypothetical protein FE78DRAFT_525698 [Acidomyces sp. 'richmondensis']KYG42817.1 hypothetical protein M433DRAFT_388050 [Acidomyces richmondensis BFW]